MYIVVQQTLELFHLAGWKVGTCRIVISNFSLPQAGGSTVLAPSVTVTVLGTSNKGSNQHLSFCDCYPYQLA